MALKAAIDNRSTTLQFLRAQRPGSCE